MSVDIASELPGSGTGKSAHFSHKKYANNHLKSAVSMPMLIFKLLLPDLA